MGRDRSNTSEIMEFEILGVTKNIIQPEIMNKPLLIAKEMLLEDCTHTEDTNTENCKCKKYQMDSRDVNWSPLHWAIFFDRLHTVKDLIQNGADMYLEDSEGRTPYQLSLLTKHDSISYYLERKQYCRLDQRNFDFNVNTSDGKVGFNSSVLEWYLIKDTNVFVDCKSVLVLAFRMLLYQGRFMDDLTITDVSKLYTLNKSLQLDDLTLMCLNHIYELLSVNNFLSAFESLKDVDDEIKGVFQCFYSKHSNEIQNFKVESLARHFGLKFSSHYDSLLQFKKHLFLSGKYSDITLHSKNGSNFFAHKSILRINPYFNALFHNDSTTEYEFPYNAKPIKCILEFLYFNELKFDNLDVNDIFQVYCLGSLMELRFLEAELKSFVVQSENKFLLQLQECLCCGMEFENLIDRFVPKEGMDIFSILKRTLVQPHTDNKRKKV